MIIATQSSTYPTFDSDLDSEFLENSIGDLFSGSFTSDIRGQVSAFLQDGIDRGVDTDCRFDVSE
jgi:hypothetical protein